MYHYNWLYMMEQIHQKSRDWLTAIPAQGDPGSYFSLFGTGLGTPDIEKSKTVERLRRPKSLESGERQLGCPRGKSNQD